MPRHERITASLYPCGQGLVALMAGPPGTDQTMAAQLIAAAPVVRRRAGLETTGSQSDGAGAGGNPVERLVALNENDLPRDILIVASQLKQYIRARFGMNTSDGVMTALSDIVRHLYDQAIRNAAADERKTVMDRDFATDKLKLDRP